VTNRSGKLYASNDELVELLVKDPNYDVRADGSVWTTVCETGKVSVDGVWREAGFARAKGSHDGFPYRYIGYQGRHLAAHRIVYRKFHGPLASDLVINHKDANTLNNRPENLELVTQSENNLCAYRNGKRPVWGNVVLTWDLVRSIRADWNAGFSNREIRVNYGLRSKGWISEIVNNRIWVDPTWVATRKYTTKANPEIAAAIRARFAAGAPMNVIKVEFGLSLTVVKDICAGRTWKLAA